MRLVEVVIGGTGGRAVDTGVVDEDVEAAGVRLDPLAEPIDAGLLGDVERHELDAPVIRRPGALGVASSGQHDVAVIGGKLAGDLAPDPTARAANQGDGL